MQQRINSLQFWNLEIIIWKLFHIPSYFFCSYYWTTADNNSGEENHILKAIFYIDLVQTTVNIFNQINFKVAVD